MDVNHYVPTDTLSQAVTVAQAAVTEAKDQLDQLATGLLAERELYRHEELRLIVRAELAERGLLELGRQLAEALGADPATPWTELIATVRAQRRDLMLEAGEDPGP